VINLLIAGSASGSRVAETTFGDESRLFIVNNDNQQCTFSTQ